MANRGVNKVILVGNLGADPDIRYIPSGDMVTTIRLATGEIWKDQDGKQQERTEWHRVVFYRRLAEVAGEFLKKGSKIYIEGSLHTQQWDKDGEKRYTTEVVAKELHLLDRAGNNESASNNGCNGRQAPAKPQQNRSASAKSSVTHGGHTRQQTVSAGTQALYDTDDSEDDIPF